MTVPSHHSSSVVNSGMGCFSIVQSLDITWTVLLSYKESPSHPFWNFMTENILLLKTTQLDDMLTY